MPDSSYYVCKYNDIMQVEIVWRSLRHPCDPLAGYGSGPPQ
jgi:hypothetical protein